MAARLNKYLTIILNHLQKKKRKRKKKRENLKESDVINKSIHEESSEPRINRLITGIVIG